MTPRTHNMLSYLGALVSAPLAALSLRSSPLSLGASVVLGLRSLHFLRRTLESAFVHRYSKASVPLGDALIEYAYYWGFGVWIGSSLSGQEINAWLMPVGAALFLLFEAGNARSHRILRALRGPGESQRVVPMAFFSRKSRARITYLKS
jgi:very-long-chain enoyl-CoA reductase